MLYYSKIMKSMETVKILACPECLTQLQLSNVQLSCPQCKKQFKTENGVFFFRSVPPGIQAEERAAANNKTQWTSWRTESHAFFEENIRNANPESVILDIGIGENQLKDITSRFENTIGMDFLPYPAATIISDLTKTFPLLSATADYIVASNVFEHLPNLPEVLQECYRVLKPGGYLISTTPFLLIGHQRPWDFNRYTDIMLQTAAEDAGFTHIVCRPLTTPFQTTQQILYHYFSILLKKNTGLTLFTLRLIRFCTIRLLRRSSFLYSTEKIPELTGGFGLYAKKE